MATIECFEDIEAWQKARVLVRRIYEVSGQGSFARDYGLRDQIRRASVSVLSNIAEGFERDGNAEFRQFLSNAKGSCGEVRAQLYAALDAGFLSPEDFAELQCLARETSRLLAGFIAYLSRSDLRGAKYR